MYVIDEILPDAPMDAEAVLHVRSHLRKELRAKKSGSALAFLFGFSGRSDDDWIAAANSETPYQAGAALAADDRGEGDIVPLGHDEDHVEECRRWLLKRKLSDSAFDELIATDLATLLELSKARDLALASGSTKEIPVLIEGPTGTGKELLARSIHKIWSKARNSTKSPFQVVHVAGMSSDMLNDELFGHVRGAYSGADKDRKGRIEAADGGVLLIDEVGDLPHDAQLRLLRVLQSQELSRLGENEIRTVRVKVIAATLHDLDEEVKNKRFREDLLHRLRVGSSIRLPSLRLRARVFDDVVPELLLRAGHQGNPLISRSALDAISRYPWPGNLRELTSALELAVALADGDTLRLEHLPSTIQRRFLAEPLHARGIGFLCDEMDGQPLTKEVARWRIKHIEASLQKGVPAEPSSQIQQIQNLVTSLDDKSGDQEEFESFVGNLIQTEAEGRSSEVIRRYWTDFLNLDLPPLASSLIRERVKEVSTAAGEAHERMTNLARSSPLEKHPWIRLLQEIGAEPLFIGTEKKDLIELFVGVFNVLRLLAPDLLQHLRGDIAENGLIALRQRAFNALGDESETEQLKRSPAALQREDWGKIASEHKTQTEATDATGYDAKTIKKYLQKHQIPNPWTRTQENRT